MQIHIVTGDEDGIGLEVSLRALNSIGAKKGVQFYLWRSPKEYPFLEKTYILRFAVPEPLIFARLKMQI